MATKPSKPTATPKKTAIPKKPAKSVKPKDITTPIKAVEKTPNTAPVATRKKRTLKATTSKSKVSASFTPKSPVAEPIIPHEEVSLRAYFIGERRQKMGWPGDSATDWLDAVAQLKAEALEKPLKKR